MAYFLGGKYNKKERGGFMEITKEYAQAYVEVLEVLKLLPKDLYNKIPNERIDIYEQYKDAEYNFIIDSNKSIECQISEITKNVVSNLFVRFLAKEKDKDIIFEKERKEFYENELKKKNQIESIQVFDNKKVTEKNNTVHQTEIVIIKEGFFKKMLNKIKAFFNK